MENCVEKTLQADQKIGRERNYGIDLLRTVSMFMVVVLHMFKHGGVLENLSGLGVISEVVWGLEILCFCAVNVYALISGFVGWNRKPKIVSIAMLYLQVLFYNTVFVVIDLVLNGGTFNLSFLRTLMPVLGNRYWYFTAYFALFFFMPLLNWVLVNAPKKVLDIALFGCVALFCCLNAIADLPFGVQSGYSLPWLEVLYLAGGYLAKYKPFERISKRKSLGLYFIFSVIQILIRLTFSKLTHGAMEMAFLQYSSIFITLSAVFLVDYFSKLEIGDSKGKKISALGGLSFGVYLIHENPICRTLFIEDVFVPYLQNGFLYVVCLPLLVALGIFVACIAIDWVRTQLFKVFRLKKLVLAIENAIRVKVEKLTKKKDTNLEN